MEMDDGLQRAQERRNALLAVHGQPCFKYISVPRGSAVVHQDAFLQRRKRINVLNVARTTRYAAGDVIELKLLELEKQQQVGGNSRTVLRNAIDGQFLNVAHDIDSSCHCSDGGPVEQLRRLNAPTKVCQSVHQFNEQQRITAGFEKIIVPAYAF